MDITFVTKIKKDPKGKKASQNWLAATKLSASELPINMPPEVMGWEEAETCTYYNEQWTCRKYKTL